MLARLYNQNRLAQSELKDLRKTGWKISTDNLKQTQSRTLFTVINTAVQKVLVEILSIVIICDLCTATETSAHLHCTVASHKLEALQHHTLSISTTDHTMASGTT